MATSRARRRNGHEAPVVPVAPLIDIVFLLLVFFMLVTRFLNPSIDLSLPQSATAEVNDQTAISLAIRADGSLTLDGQPVGWEGLTAQLARRADEAALVRVRADEATQHRDVIRALDCIRQAGLTEIALETATAEAD